jgi:hypothetical protein
MGYKRRDGLINRAPIPCYVYRFLLIALVAAAEETSQVPHAFLALLL